MSILSRLDIENILYGVVPDPVLEGVGLACPTTGMHSATIVFSLESVGMGDPFFWGDFEKYFEVEIIASFNPVLTDFLKSISLAAWASKQPLVTKAVQPLITSMLSNYKLTDDVDFFKIPFSGGKNSKKSRHKNKRIFRIDFLPPPPPRWPPTPMKSFEDLTVFMSTQRKVCR